VLAALLLVLATLAGYARRAVFNSNQFATRAADTLKDESVRNLIAERVTDDLVLKQQADLLAARPLIQSAISSLVGGSAFRSIFIRGVRDVHRAVFQHDENTLTLTVADVGSIAGAALEKFRPKLAARLENQGRVVLVKRDVGDTTGRLARLANDVRVLAYLLAGLTLLAASGALLLSTDRRATTFELGVGMAIGGVFIVVACVVVRAYVLSRVHDPDSRAAAAAIWSAFVNDLRTFGWVLAGSGAVIAAAADSILRPVAIEGTLREGWQMITREPKATWLRVARAVGLIALGALVVAASGTALEVVATLVGVYLIYRGIVVILALVYHPSTAEREELAADRRFVVRRVAVPLIAVLVIGGGLVAFLAGGGTTQGSPIARVGCNGFKALCDKRLDQVVLPATHNSMSVPLPGWFSAEQETPIGTQLADGIRGLLLDTHYGDKLPNGRVRTDFPEGSKPEQLAQQDGVSPQAVQAALRIRSRLGFRGKGARGIYLCHTFCEIGATLFSTALTQIHDFLVTHPNDVMVVINQDYVTPADIVKAIGNAGLTQYVFKDFDKKPWPTLQEMIDTNQRLVLLAENHAGAAPWYRPAYKSLTEETPYTFRNVADLSVPENFPASCRPNRGAEGAPLFLINHWISTDPVPLPSNAAKVNAYKPLLGRAQACQKIRHHLPNLLAVNFYREGDLFKVVDQLNGVGEKVVP
jgi:uncharacterized membrane protein HdeD (DUF308 family)